MITYNHEKFIAEAIEGVLMQKTNFPIELIIGDDASSDGNAKIIEDYRIKHPDIIKPIFREKNIGMIPNFVDTIKACRGKYIAICEGDDYWTDPLKLQKQFDFMESNTDCVLCFHDAFRYDSASKKRSEKGMRDHFNQFNVSIKDLLEKNPIPTLTTFFKNGLIREFPTWYFEGGGGDRSLYFLLSKFGDITYLPMISAAYRVHESSATQMHRLMGLKGEIIKIERRIKMYNHFNRFFEYQYDKMIKQIQLELRVNLFLVYYSLGLLKEAYEYKRNNNLVFCEFKSLKLLLKYWRTYIVAKIKYTQ